VEEYDPVFCWFPQPARRAVTRPSRLNLINMREEIVQALGSIGLEAVMARSVSKRVVTLVSSRATASSIFLRRAGSAVGLALIDKALCRVISSGAMRGGSSSKWAGRKEEGELVVPGGRVRDW